MHPTANPESHRPLEVAPAPSPRAPWRVASVRVAGDHVLHVTFLDGLEGEVDMHQWLFEPRISGTVFEALRDASVFALAYVEFGAVTWPNGADLAPDAMHEHIKRHGRWAMA
jgi:Protein of unknown function (DUF2442)